MDLWMHPSIREQLTLIDLKLDALAHRLNVHFHQPDRVVELREGPPPAPREGPW
jgi:hypothetical protein